MQMKEGFSKNKNRGLTLIEVLVGSSLMLIVFVGIFGAFQLGMRMIGLSKNKITATAIANQRLELIRNLPYQSIGIAGGFPDGVLEQATTTLRNGIEYNIETRIDYVVDSSDGIAAPDDDCPNDYKRAQIKVSWSGQSGGETKLLTDIVPKNLAQECAETGGILSVSVFDAFGIMVPSPLIEVKDFATGETINTATPGEGKHYFSLPAKTYKVVVSKSGYSQEQTFGIGEAYQGKIIVTPEAPNPIVLDGQLTQASFSIDHLSSFLIETLSSWGVGGFSDAFLDESKIFEISNIAVSEGEVNFVSPLDEGSGYLISVPIVPENLVAWDEFSWNGNEPEETDIKYQVLYFDGENWVLIPDSDLPSNSVGFDSSPLDLSGLDKTGYPQLKIKANFSTLNLDLSPALYDWDVSWQTSNPTPIAYAVFGLKGQKIVGRDSSDSPIYKYSQNHTSDFQGRLNIPNMEWDAYNFSVDAGGLDIIGIEPEPQPVSLVPDVSQTVKLYLKAENSLLLNVQNIETLEPIFSASVRLQNSGLGYDVTQYTNEAGQTYFVPLEPAVYNLEITAAGYSGSSPTVSVFGDATKTVKLQPVE